MINAYNADRLRLHCGVAGFTKCPAVIQHGQTYWTVFDAAPTHLPELLEATKQKAERGVVESLLLLQGREKMAKMGSHTWEAVQFSLI